MFLGSVGPGNHATCGPGVCVGEDQSIAATLIHSPRIRDGYGGGTRLPQSVLYCMKIKGMACHLGEGFGDSL